MSPTAARRPPPADPFRMIHQLAPPLQLHQRVHHGPLRALPQAAAKVHQERLGGGRERGHAAAAAGARAVDAAAAGVCGRQRPLPRAAAPVPVGDGVPLATLRLPHHPGRRGEARSRRLHAGRLAGVRGPPAPPAGGGDGHALPRAGRAGYTLRLAGAARAAARCPAGAGGPRAAAVCRQLAQQRAAGRDRHLAGLDLRAHVHGVEQAAALCGGPRARRARGVQQICVHDAWHDGRWAGAGVLGAGVLGQGCLGRGAWARGLGQGCSGRGGADCS